MSTHLRVEAFAFGEGDSLFLALAILDSKESPAAPPAPEDLLRLSRGGGGEGEADPDADRLFLLLAARSLERERDRDRALRILDRGGEDLIFLVPPLCDATTIFSLSLAVSLGTTQMLVIVILSSLAVQQLSQSQVRTFQVPRPPPNAALRSRINSVAELSRRNDENWVRLV